MSAVACLLFIVKTSVCAQVWIQTSAPSNRWYSVATSADGTKMAAVVNNSSPSFTGQIYCSTNSGATWATTSASDTNWTSIASSADGAKLAACFNVPGGGRIYVSTNSGNTWQQAGAPTSGWRSLASSANGQKLFAASSSGEVFVSTNSGGTWIAMNLVNTNWTSVSCSADGTKILVAANFGPTCISTNSGATWVSGNSGSWFCTACSASGERFAVGGYDESAQPAIHVSTNSGATWENANAPSVPSWQSLCFSSDGLKLIVGGYPGPIYSSQNLGGLWMSNSAPYQLWRSIAGSADGNTLVAVAWGGSIFTLRSTPAPSLKLGQSSNSALLSWILPSTNFVLQQTASLSSTNWINVSNTPVLNLTNLQNEVTLPISMSNLFFRLKTP